VKLLEGKVAVVTGAGGGLGRCHALALAAEGARVVVNDVGGSRDGTGASRSMADQVVEEIRKAGGQAAANYDSVATTEGAERIVRTAIDAFGRLDILVNNAGILRDKTLLKMDDDMWDLVIAVHLRGTFACTRAAARAMGSGGRIVNTTSIAGLRGNFGQTNYGAAKAAIYGFTLSAALELAKQNITVNAIAPIAKTRMTEEIESVSEEMRPEDVSPVVVFLASDLAKEISGRIFGVHGRHIFEYQMQSTEGFKKEAGAWTPSEIAAKLSAPPEPAKAAPPGRADLIEQFFAGLPSVFVPADWKAALHFAIAGAGDWTVEVDGPRCRAAAGKPAQPTCVVSMDAATLTGMIRGQVNADAAFMQGKIKATNLKDLMKFGKAFDLKKLRGAAPSAPRAAVNVAPLLEQLPSRFIPDKAMGWNGAIHVAVEGVDWTLEIQNQKCAGRPGRPPSAALTIATDGATLAELLEGKLDSQKAASEGRIKLSNPLAFLKFKQCFRFEPERGLRRTLIGKVYRAPALLVRPEWIKAYGEVVGDADSPVFPVTLVKPLFLGLIEDPEFNGDLARMVHGEQEIRFSRPLRGLDLVSPRGRVLSIEDKTSGQLLNFGQTLYVEGRPVVEMESRLFFRGEATAPRAAEKFSERPDPEVVEEITIPEDLSYRYAKVSGDSNPIHIDPAAAKSAGFEGVILHGLCSLALAVGRLRKGRPVSRLAVRFAKPVYPGRAYRVRAWGSTFDMVSPSGEPVLTQGVSHFSPSETRHQA
jgi:NAD(P)-dependent dehydrogenase (short-subunit alcohol dehydrogenase family)/acyl dehydratase/putative sterol carrier protein